MHHVIQHMYLVRERSLTLPQAAQLVASPVQIQDSWTWGRFTGVFPQKENLSLLSFPSSSFPLSPSPLAEPTREFMESNKLEKIEKVAKKCNYRGLFPPSADMLTPPQARGTLSWTYLESQGCAANIVSHGHISEPSPFRAWLLWKPTLTLKAASRY